MKIKLDEDSKRRKKVFKYLKGLSIDEIFDLAVKAGIYTKKGRLTKRYRDRS